MEQHLPEATARELLERLIRVEAQNTLILQEMKKMSEQQADLDQDVTLIGNALTDVVAQTTKNSASVAALTTYIQQLVAGDSQLDLSALDALAQAAAGDATALDASVASVGALVPTATATPAPASGTGTAPAAS